MKIHVSEGHNPNLIETAGLTFRFDMISSGSEEFDPLQAHFQDSPPYARCATPGA